MNSLLFLAYRYKKRSKLYPIKSLERFILFFKLLLLLGKRNLSYQSISSTNTATILTVFSECYIQQVSPSFYQWHSI